MLSTRKSALKTSLIYFVISIIYIISSDSIVNFFTQDPYIITAIQSYKGSAFVILTAMLIYYLSKRSLDKIHKSIENELELRKSQATSEANFKNLFEFNPMPMLIYDFETMAFIEVNNAAVNNFGISRQKFLSTRIDDPKFDKENNYLFDYIVNIGDTNNKPYEYIYYNSNEKTIIFNIKTYQIGFNNRTSIQVVFNDITERKLIEKELIAAKEKSEESNRLKTAFIQNLSHEIRTPLNGIIGFANLLLYNDLEKDETNDYISIINESCNRLLELVNNILDISRIETKQIDLHQNDVDVTGLLNDLHLFFIPQAQNKNLELKLNISDSFKSLIVITDEFRLFQVLSNLISNAIKFTQTGTIELGVNLEQDHIVFYVKDSGIGISKENYNLIFENFMQIDQSLSRVNEGIGLGLSICKGLVSILGGQLWLESDLGNGSTFYVSIPLHHKTNN